MKANVQTLVSMALLGLALFLHSLPAWAGDTRLSEVTIQDNPNEVGIAASGTTAGTRYSSDTQQYIGCSIYGYYGSVSCAARDKSGRALVCYSQGAKWVAAAEAMTDFSEIRFKSNRYNGTCDRIEINNSSSYLR